MRFSEKLLCTFIILISFSLLSCNLKTRYADLVLLNGKIYTVEKHDRSFEAMAIKDGKINALGDNDDMELKIGPDTEVIDLDGKTVIPGFIESHAHFMGLGNAKLNLDLSVAKNYDEIVEMVKQAVAKSPKGAWITGRGWHQEKWDKIPEPNVDGLPFHNKLSEISPDNPVYLRHASGHSSMANANAMRQAGLTDDSENPPGGEILKDSNGKLIGIFRENGDSLITTAYNNYLDNRTPQEIKADRLQKLKLAQEECLSYGITSFHDAGVSFEMVDYFKEAIDDNQLDIRLYVMLYDDSPDFLDRISEYKTIGYGDNHLTVRAVKRYVDGALGSHGAWLLKPYDDLPSSSGINVVPLEVLEDAAEACIEDGFQLCIHAIGDRGNREVLDIYERVFEINHDHQDLRWRIEHAQHLDPEDIPRFSKMNIIAAMQGVHCTSDGPWVPKRIGDKRSKDGAYVWQELLNNEAIICNGTDAPVEKIDPFANFFSLVTREMANGERFYPEQKMSRKEALRAYTINGAYAAFEEDIKGTIKVGKLADLVVLSQDILKVPVEDIPNTEVLYTIVGGEIKYRKE